MRTLAGMVLCVLVAGCSSVQRPTASFRSMSIGDVNTKGFTMNVDVDVQNPNSVALPLSNVDYGLGLGGVKVIDKARAKPASSIPANGTGTVTIPVALTFENLLSAEEAIRKGGGAVEYALDAGLNFDTGLPVLGVQRVPFSYAGTLNVAELLKKNWSTILNSPAARELAQKALGGLFKF